MIPKGLTAITWKEDGQWVSQCLDVDVASMGETQCDALHNLNEAVELYFEDEQAKDIPRVTRGSVSVHELDHA